MSHRTKLRINKKIKEQISHERLQVIIKDQSKKRLKGQKWLWILLCYPIGGLCLILAQNSSFLAEELFSKRIFWLFSQSVATITGWIPFSLAEMILVIGIPVLLLFFLIYFIRLVRQKEQRRKCVQNGLIRAGKGVLIAGGILFLWFVLGCGVNYYRYPFSYYSGLEVKESSVEELYGLCRELAECAGCAREELLSEEESKIYQYQGSMKELGNAAKQAYITLARQYPILSGIYPSPKPVLLSKLMSRTEITGIFIPFTMEANVNIDIPDYSLGSTMCHELAHLHGFIREDEANYISYLACIHSGNPDLVYSGYMEALIISANALYAKNKELYYQVKELYTTGMIQDLVDNSLYWKQFENTVISNTANKINDVYLKINNQEDGVQSYGRMVDLLLAEYRQRQEGTT